MKSHLFSILALFVFCVSFVAAQTKTNLSEQERYKLAADYSKRFRGLSVLIVKNGKVVFEEYQNGHSAETAHQLASGTKSFSGVMLAAAIEDKLIKSFDEKVSDTITEWKTDAKKSKITIRQLLSLTSGIDTGENGRPPAYSAAVNFPAKYEAGSTFEYGPAPFQIFGELMRRKLLKKNESVMDYLKRRILDPIGLNVSSWTMQNGQPNLPSGAFLTAREWAKFGQFVESDGRWNGKQIIAKKLLDETLVGTKTNPNYGLTFWLNRSNDGKANVAEKTNGRRQDVQDALGIEPETTRISQEGIAAELPKDTFMAAGAGKQRLYVIPSMNLVIVRQGRQGRFEDREFLLRLLFGKES
ncbi:MAG TPA: serine hydrolase [Pyrinomonadaceae bacterium]|jgi:CubicO group peptidase (beta-lactamase class C family)